MSISSTIDLGTGFFLHSGSWLYRFCPSLCLHPPFGFLYHSRQEKFSIVLVETTASSTKPQDSEAIKRFFSMAQRALRNIPIPFVGSAMSISKRPNDSYSLTNNFMLNPLYHYPIIQMPLAGRTLLQVDQTTPSNQVFLWNLRERSEDPNLDRCQYVCSRRHHQERIKTRPKPQRNLANLSITLFEKSPIHQVLLDSYADIIKPDFYNQLSLYRFLTGRY